MTTIFCILYSRSQFSFYILRKVVAFKYYYHYNMDFEGLKLIDTLVESPVENAYKMCIADCACFSSVQEFDANSFGSLKSQLQTTF